ncbi:hypothetical protein BJ912DRAFT_993724 [Pholiota molesta]|nr:hypothetical protein BJ912DRAFT_993724 [Pholiota molesta]
MIVVLRIGTLLPVTLPAPMSSLGKGACPNPLSDPYRPPPHSAQRVVANGTSQRRSRPPAGLCHVPQPRRRSLILDLAAVSPSGSAHCALTCRAAIPRL